jgi:hypothetical protein
MIAELALATAMVLLTVAIHGTGLFSLSRLLRLEAIEEREEHITPLSPRGLVVTLVVILGLFVVHGVEIWLYAFLYNAIGAVEGSGSRSISRPSPMPPSAMTMRRWPSPGGWCRRSRGSTASSCWAGRRPSSSP